MEASGRSGQGVKRRRLFGPEDDRMLEDIITKHDFNGWKNVAKLMPGFTPKQLRDRWHNYINPKNQFGPWTPEEDSIVVQKVSEFGTKWSLISSLLKGRSDNCVKNRWNSYLKEKVLANPQFMKSLPKKSSTQNQAFDPCQIKVPEILPVEQHRQNILLDPRFIDHFFERRQSTITQEVVGRSN